MVAAPACEAEAEPSPPPPRRTMLTRTPLLLLALCLGACAAVPAASEGGASKAERLQAQAEQNMRQADATIDQLQNDMKRMDTFADEVRRNLDEEAKAKQDLSHALGYFHRQMELSSDERDVSHGRVSRLEDEVTALQRKVHQLEGQLETCHKDKVRAAALTPLPPEAKRLCPGGWPPKSALPSNFALPLKSAS